MFSSTFKVLQGPYSQAKEIFEKVDVEMGFVIDKFRRSRLKREHKTHAEQDVVEQIHAFDDITNEISLDDNEKQQLLDKQGQLKWTLKQMRGSQE